MTIKEVLRKDNKFKYMLLSRLQSDCYSYGGYWAGNANDQVNYMVAIWDDLKTKPEWLPLKELNKLSIKLTRKEVIR
jgi:hypothetical protein